MTARRVSFDKVEILEEKVHFRRRKTTVVSVNSFEQNYRRSLLSPTQKNTRRRRSTRKTGELLPLPNNNKLSMVESMQRDHSRTTSTMRSSNDCDDRICSCSNVARHHSYPGGQPTSRPLPDSSELNNARDDTYAIRHDSSRLIDSSPSICMVEGRWSASSGSSQASNLLCGQERILQLRKRTRSCCMPVRAHMKAFNQEIFEMGDDILV